MRYILGDCCVQYACDEPWDPVRTLLFASFGFSYASTAGYVVYNRIYALRALATRPVLTAFIDCLTNMPMLYFPAFYVAREFALCTDNRGIEDPLAVAKSGLARARGNLGEDIVMGGAFWFPFHIVNFTLFPIHLRQPVMAVVGFGWATLLSLVRGNLSSEDTNKDNVGYRVAALSKEGYQTLLSPALCEEDRDPDLVALLNR